MHETPAKVDLAGAEPLEDALDREWVRTRAARGLFGRDDDTVQVGRFVLGARIGAGGMGIVYEAYDPELDRQVAIKLVRVHDAGDRDATHAEAQALAKVSHPNVVAVHDVGILDDQVYLVMEFIRGDTLRAVATSEQTSQAKLIAAYRQACEGLMAAHAGGLVHRDFKPDNALLGEDGRVRVIDFGIATAELAGLGSQAGTPRYMAPEQRAGEPLTAAADQYALCASLREGLLAVGESIPGWLEQVLDRGTADSPTERYSTVRDLDAALADDPRLRWRRRAVWAAAAIAIGGAFTVGAVVMSSEPLAACDGGATEIEAAWPASERSAALAELGEGGPYAASIAADLEANFATFRNAWQSSHNSVCKTHRRGEQSSAIFDRQTVCLARAKRAYRAAAAILSEVEAAELPIVSSSLPSPSACEDLESIGSVAPPPPHLAEQVAEVEIELEAVRVDLVAGQVARASERVDALRVQASTLSYPPLAAELELLAGRTLMTKDEFAAALAPFTRALELATLVGDDSVAVEAWARRAYVRSRTDNLKSALDGFDMVRAVARRHGDRGFATALMFNNIGVVEMVRGDRKAARAALLRAVELAKDIKGRGAFELSHAMGNLAIVTDEAAERDRLTAAAVSRFEALVGATHPQTLNAIMTRALSSENAAAAAQLLAPSCQVWLDQHPSLVGRTAACYRHLVWLAAAAGDTDQARDAATRLGELADDELTIALVAVMTDDPARALEVLPKQSAPDADAWWAVLAAAERNLLRGRALDLKGDRQGRRLIESAVERLRSISSQHSAVRRRLELAARWRTRP